MRRAAPSFQAARRMTEVLGLWFGRHQERKQMRRELPTLTPEQLRDLDLTHKQAEELANKPFWRE
ncbi:MAG: DUF1127 domain-containing protein [Rhizobiaceae bacterium]|nr:DUF1127 domain-containing protein [Rhizobiaceae bacterium]